MATGFNQSVLSSLTFSSAIHTEICLNSRPDCPCHAQLCFGFCSEICVYGAKSHWHLVGRVLWAVHFVMIRKPTDEIRGRGIMNIE